MTRAPAALAILTALAVATAGCDVERSLPPTPSAARATGEDQLAAQLQAHARAVPGVTAAAIVVHLAPVDPFARAAAPAHAPARIAGVIATGPGADATLVHDAVASAARALAGDDAVLAITVAPPPPVPPSLTPVGPFEVARGSRAPLLATLAVALAAIAALATALAYALARRP